MPAVPVANASPLALEDLLALTAKSAQSFSVDDVLRHFATGVDTFVDLIAWEQRVTLPVDVLKQLVMQMLAVPKVWVWHSMSDTYRIAFTKTVSKHKVLQPCTARLRE